jgi:hypothetical protein
MNEPPRIYLETSFISYLAARPSRDLVTAQRQLSSSLWWTAQRAAFQLCVSPFVEEECKRGDAEVVMRRLGYLKEALMLAPADQILLLRDVLLQPHGPLPVRAATDALHIGTAAFFGCDYLLTWNFTHIANARLRPMLDNIVRKQGYEPATICIPDELGGGLD